MKREAERIIYKTLRLTKNEAEHIRAQAEAAGVTTSNFIRSCALNCFIQTRADLAILNELRRQGGLVKHLYNNGADPDVTRSALRTLENIAAQLIRR